MNTRVRIGTCTSSQEATLVRAAFDAHEIPVLINAEHHASMIGGLGAAFVPLHIYVAEEHAEEGAELLRDLREQDHTQEAHDGATETSGEEPDDDSAEVAAARADRRRRIGILMLAPLCGVVALPFVIGRPVLETLLAIGVIGLFAIAIFGKRRPAALPTARVTKHKTN